MNPFKSVVDWAYKKPNLLVAVVLALLPALFSLLLLVVYNFPVDYMTQAYLVARALIVLVVSAVILYVVLYVFKGNQISGKFLGVLTAFSFTYLIRLIFLILGVSVILFLAPAFFPTLSKISAMDLTQDQFLDYMESIPVQEGWIAFAGTIFIVIAAIATIIAIAYLLYQVIAKSAPSGRLTNIIILLILLFFLILIEAIIP